MSGRKRLAAGAQALARGEWDLARDAFQAAWEASGSADALDGLARALWWLDDPAAALELRARAFALMRHEGRDLEAAAIAVWLARQYRALYRSPAIAEGWLARARSLLAEAGSRSSLAGWIALAEAEAGQPGMPAAVQADIAVRIAGESGDRDLEIIALSRRGLCRASAGAVPAGLADLHEAMAAATSGEGEDVQYVGEALCTLLEVAGLIGDPGIVEPWAELLTGFRSSYSFGPLLPFDASSVADLISAFCTGCCGGVYLVTGRLDVAEPHLVRAVEQLATTGVRPRCLHPVADLVALRVLQGRLEEAAALLDGFEGDVECADAAAALDLARGQPHGAVDRLCQALDACAGSPLSTLPLHARLVDAAIEAGDLDLAQDSVRGIAQIAALTGTQLHAAHHDHARGKLALARSADGAAALLRTACLRFAECGASLPACQARLGLARALLPRDRGRAVTEARSALQALDRMGASAEGDRAAAFLRGLGVAGRTGPRDLGVLSRRETEVLRLVAEGLSNAEIGSRLYISVKTAGNHVSNLLTKLDLRNRTEAAAFALLHLPPLPVPGRKTGNSPHAAGARGEDARSKSTRH